MIFRYLKGTSKYEFWYDRSNDFTLSAYTDEDWASSLDEKKSTSGGAFFLGGRLISWLSKKIDCISQSIVEAEYVATANNCNQVMCMKQMLKDIGISFEELVIIYCNNMSIVNMSKNHVLHSKTKHISIKYHVLKEKIAKKEIKLEYINGKEQITNIFLKTLPKDAFEYLRGMLGVMPLPTLVQKMQ